MKVMGVIRILCIGLSVVLACGCESEKKKTQKKDQAALLGFPQKWRGLPDQSVVIRIGDRTITKNEYENYVRVMRECIRIKFPKTPSDKLDMVVRKRLMSVRDEVISKMLLRQGLPITNQLDRTAQREHVMRQYERSFSPRKQKVTFAQILDAMKREGLEAAFMRNFEHDLHVSFALKTDYAEQLKVTDQEFKDSRENVEKRNRNARATNEWNQATANKVWERLKKGENFAQLADEFSQDRNRMPGGDLGECDLSSLSFSGMDPQMFEQTTYWKAISKLHDGEFTPVLETDVGWEIVKMIAHIDKGSANAEVDSFHLARIYFRRVYECPEQNDEEFMDDLKQEKRDIFLQNVAKNVQEKFKVEFPSGEGIFPGFKKQAGVPVGPRKELLGPEFQQ